MSTWVNFINHKAIKWVPQELKESYESFMILEIYIHGDDSNKFEWISVQMNFQYLYIEIKVHWWEKWVSVSVMLYCYYIKIN